MLLRARNGEPQLLERVFEVLYAELHRLAESRFRDGSQTLTPTALVHETFLRLVGNENLSQ